MEWFIAALAVLVVGLAALAAAGGLGQFGPVEVDRPPLTLPDSPLTAHDLAGVRFAVVPRGYAMEQVDDLLKRLQSQLPDAADCSPGSGSGIIEEKDSSDRRIHDGSDETSYG